MLSEIIRVGLDSRVDADSLERFIAKYPWSDKARKAIINSCLHDPEEGVPGVGYFVDPTVQSEWEQIWRKQGSR